MRRLFAAVLKTRTFPKYFFVLESVFLLLPPPWPPFFSLIRLSSKSARTRDCQQLSGVFIKQNLSLSDSRSPKPSPRLNSPFLILCRKLKIPRAAAAASLLQTYYLLSLWFTYTHSSFSWLLSRSLYLSLSVRVRVREWTRAKLKSVLRSFLFQKSSLCDVQQLHKWALVEFPIRPRFWGLRSPSLSPSARRSSLPESRSDFVCLSIPAVVAVIDVGLHATSTREDAAVRFRDTWRKNENVLRGGETKRDEFETEKKNYFW